MDFSLSIASYLLVKIYKTLNYWLTFLINSNSLTRQLQHWLNIILDFWKCPETLNHFFTNKLLLQETNYAESLEAQQTAFCCFHFSVAWTKTHSNEQNTYFGSVFFLLLNALSFCYFFPRVHVEFSRWQDMCQHKLNICLSLNLGSSTKLLNNNACMKAKLHQPSSFLW